MSELAYASATDILLEAFAGLLPPDRVDVATWATRERWMSNTGGGHVGRYTHDRAPYTVAPSRCLTSLDYLTTAVVGPGQVAKTVIAENWLGYSIDTDPADFLWYMQSDDGIESYVKGRINPFIDDHEVLRSKLGLRPVDDSLHFKRFRGMSAEFLPFGPRTIINKSAPRLVVDEVDNFQWLGDVKPVLDVRRQTFGRQSMLLALSHPDMARGLEPSKDWTAGIMAMYADSTRCEWYWPCPHCGAWSSPIPTARRFMSLEYPTDLDVPLDVVEAEAHLLCPVNGCVIGNEHREEMNLLAYRNPGSLDGYIGDGMEISEGGEVSGELIRRDTAGFWIVGAMSPFVLGGIGGLARERAKAERTLANTGEDGPLRQVVVKQWGIPYSPSRGVGSIAASDLVDRTEAALQLGVVPIGVRFLVLVVDVQIWGFEYLVRGFGSHGESWIIDRGRLAADGETAKAIDPATSAEDWDRLLKLFDRAYPLADGSGRVMRIRAKGFDSAGQPGVTEQAYSAFRRWRKQGQARMLGVVGGREAWTIIPTKGLPGVRTPRLTVAYPDTTRKASKKVGRGEVPVAMFNPNLFKDDLAGQLKTAEVGPGYIHFPAELKAKAPPHPWFEQLVAEQRKPAGDWEKIQAHAKNEALDLMVLSQVVAHLHGHSRIDWENPPPWAADWDVNTNIAAPAAAEDPANPVREATSPADIAKRLADRLA